MELIYFAQWSVFIEHTDHYTLIIAYRAWFTQQSYQNVYFWLISGGRLLAQSELSDVTYGSSINRRLQAVAESL